MSDGDLDIDLGFRLAAINAVEQQNLFDFASPAQQRLLNPPRPVLAILAEFAEKKIKRVARQEGGLLPALKALRELWHVVSDLVRWCGRPELKEILSTLEAGMTKIAQASRQRLVQSYLDPTTPPDEVEMINEALVYIISKGAWPDWQREFNEAVERCSPSIAPTLTAR
jgi:hypothetical protein